MKALTLILFAGLFFVFSKANALTVDEIIKLKQGGVSDETIQLLNTRDSNNRPSSKWKTKDGWIVHSTEMGGSRLYFGRVYQDPYPVVIYRGSFTGRREHKLTLNRGTL